MTSKRKFNGKSREWKNGYVQAKRDIYEALRINDFGGVIEPTEKRLNQ